MDADDLLLLTRPVTVHAQRCIHRYNSRSTCSRCINVCPEGGIGLTDNVIEADACIGCGRCIQQCPMDVFSLDMAAALEGNSGLCVLVCSKSDIDDAPVIRTRCLSQFTSLQLALLVRKFGQVALYAASDDCDGCQCSWYPRAQLLLMEQNGLQTAADHVHVFQKRADFLHYLNRDNDEGRRQFLKNLALRTRTETRRTVSDFFSSYKNAAQANLTQKQVPFEKVRSHGLAFHELLQAEPDQEAPIRLEKLSLTHCRFCRICEKLCPWEALAYHEEGDHAWMLHHDALCAHCGLCLDLCPEGGLSWRSGMSVKDMAQPHWRPLAKAEKRICVKCGQAFYSSDPSAEKCSICSNK